MASKARSLDQINHSIVQSQHHHKPSLQSRLAALYFSISYGLFMYIWILSIITCIYFPSLIIPLALYTIYIFSDAGKRPSLSASYPTPFKKWGLWRHFYKYFPHVTVHKSSPLDPSQSHIFCYHPHGVLAVGAWLTFGTHYAGFSDIDVRVLTLDINFRAPFLREYLLLHGVCSVSRPAIKTILSNGKSVMLAVGGGSESLLAAPGHYDVILKRRRGFVKIALETGSNLVPCISFGENELFSTVNSLPPSSPIRKFQKRIEKLFGFTLPLAFGSGVLMKYGVLPYSKPLDIVIGEPIKVEKYEGEVGDAKYNALVDKYHAIYMNALVTLFNENKDKYGKSGAELKIVE